MTYRFERAVRVDRDIEAIFDFLTQSYIAFGERKSEALNHAAARIEGIEDAMEASAKTPHIGTLRPDLRPDVRTVSQDRAIFYFETDDVACRVRILAVFFGGQDHRRAMLKRLLGLDSD
jgi:toxin ParE1/3/4